MGIAAVATAPAIIAILFIAAPMTNALRWPEKPLRPHQLRQYAFTHSSERAARDYNNQHIHGHRTGKRDWQ